MSNHNSNSEVLNKQQGVNDYVHDDYKLRRMICRFLLKTIGFTLLVKVDTIEGLENVPAEGPGVIVMNHIGYVDPLVLVSKLPRYIVPLAKAEAYEDFIEGFFPRIWGVIPVQRGEFDRRAIKQALEVLAAGELLLVAPEGTRNPAIGETREGVAYLASRGDAPIIPVAMQNTLGYPMMPFGKRWWEKGAHVKIGKPFSFKPELKRSRGNDLRKMTDEVMYKIAKMLPPELQGQYSHPENVTFETIDV